MRKHGLGKMPVWQRWFTITSLSICSLSGIALLVGHEFHISKTILGNHLVLALHGIAAAFALMAFGAVMPFHIKAGLKAKKEFNQRNFTTNYSCNIGNYWTFTLLRP